MINYIVNFQEMEESLKDLLSNFSLKGQKTNFITSYDKFSLTIPPMEIIKEFIIENRIGGLIELAFDVDGFSVDDFVEVYFDGELKGKINFCYSNRVLKFDPFDGQIKLRYFNSGGYKKLKIYSSHYTSIDKENDNA